MDHSYYDEDVIKECISNKIAQKGNIMISSYNKHSPFECRVIDINTKSKFTSFRVVINDMSEIFEIFELCEKLELLRELLIYNFNTIAFEERIIIMDSISIKSNGENVHMLDIDNLIIYRMPLKTLYVYEFINHPLLQPYRIIHSKPIITFEQ